MTFIRWVITIGIILMLAAAGAVYYAVTRAATAPLVNTKEIDPLEQEIPRPKNVGEQITYQVQLGKLNLGTSKFNFIDAHLDNGSYISEMLFETKVLQFSDKEHIFSDAQLFLPITVERTITNILSKETIREEYDQKKFLVTVIKTKGHIVTGKQIGRAHV